MKELRELVENVSSAGQATSHELTCISGVVNTLQYVD